MGLRRSNSGVLCPRYPSLPSYVPRDRNRGSQPLYCYDFVWIVHNDEMGERVVNESTSTKEDGFGEILADGSEASASADAVIDYLKDVTSFRRTLNSESDCGCALMAGRASSSCSRFARAGRLS